MGYSVTKSAGVLLLSFSALEEVTAEGYSLWVNSEICTYVLRAPEPGAWHTWSDGMGLVFMRWCKHWRWGVHLRLRTSAGGALHPESDSSIDSGTPVTWRQALQSPCGVSVAKAMVVLGGSKGFWSSVVMDSGVLLHSSSPMENTPDLTALSW